MLVNKATNQWKLGFWKNWKMGRKSDFVGGTRVRNSSGRFSDAPGSISEIFVISKNIAKIPAKKGGFGTLEGVLACKCFIFLRQKSDPRGVSGT